MLIDGKWEGDWQQRSRTDDGGQFIRESSTFRHWVTPDGSAGPTGESGFKAEPGRYHLYIALNCPWACRALIYRKLKKLDDIISLSITAPNLPIRATGFANMKVRSRILCTTCVTYTNFIRTPTPILPGAQRCRSSGIRRTIRW